MGVECVLAFDTVVARARGGVSWKRQSGERPTQRACVIWIAFGCD